MIIPKITPKETKPQVSRRRTYIHPNTENGVNPSKIGNKEKHEKVRTGEKGEEGPDTTVVQYRKQNQGVQAFRDSKKKGVR